MKLTIKKDILLEALNKVSKAISTKNLIPVLAGIKFELNEYGTILCEKKNIDLNVQNKVATKTPIDIGITFFPFFV